MQSFFIHSSLKTVLLNGKPTFQLKRKQAKESSGRSDATTFIRTFQFSRISRYTETSMVQIQMARLPSYFKLVLESLEIFSITADINIYGIIRDLLS